MDSITFKKPDLKKIKEEGYSCIDMHVHSKYSDGFNRLEVMIKKAAKKGFGIALTDHNTIDGVLKASKLRLVMTKKIMFIPAIELNAFDGPHLLCYFYNTNELTEFYERFIRNNKNKNPNGRIKLDSAYLVDKLSHYNCIISLAHPFGPAWTNIERVTKNNPQFIETLKRIHALELINGEQLRISNIKSIILNEKLHKCFTGGSDGHSIFEFGSVMTFAIADNTDDFLDKIRLKKNFIVGREIEFLKRFIVHPLVVRKHIPYVAGTIKESYSKKVSKRISLIMKKFNRK